jgi:flagellin-like hook-associated protein FlgL
MKRLVPNAVPITSNYEEITTLWEEIIKISNDATITGENLLALKTNIEMKLGSKSQDYFIIKQFQ